MTKQYKILYLGPNSGTCLHRANALKRIGHDVNVVDLRQYLPTSHWIDRIIWNLGGHYLSFFIKDKLNHHLMHHSYDICWVDGGDLVSPSVMELLKSNIHQIVNYSIDDPFGKRDRARFKAMRMSVPLYDLIVVVRGENVNEAYALGAQHVFRVYRSADEVVHKAQNISEAEYEALKSDVLFAGTWFPERCDFMLKLIEFGVPLTIRGDRWNKSPHWDKLKAYCMPGLHNDQYVKLIQSSKICLGLLSKGNRDLHTTRSSEIPAIGSLFCAERTVEHEKMYVDGKEALFWSDAEECAKVCMETLNHPELIKEISTAGHKRAMQEKYLNEKVVSDVLDVLVSS